MLRPSVSRSVLGSSVIFPGIAAEFGIFVAICTCCFKIFILVGILRISSSCRVLASSSHHSLSFGAISIQPSGLISVIFTFVLYSTVALRRTRRRTAGSRYRMKR